MPEAPKQAAGRPKLTLPLDAVKPMHKAAIDGTTETGGIDA
jgi:hypothetical protein